MGDPTIALFSMAEQGHFKRALPLISLLSSRGLSVYVFTAKRFAAEVRDAGGRLVDVLDRYPLEQADDRSYPIPSRFVTYAAHFGRDITREVKEVGANLVIYDTFAVVGRVVARELGLPYVNVCAGHNVDPEKFLAMLADDPRVDLSSRCVAAVETLRERFGIEDASPFSYVSGLSPYLNVYCEPPAYLTDDERRVFEPVAFFGSLPSVEVMRDRDLAPAPSYFPQSTPETKVYASFGTVVWRYWAEQALSALTSIAQFVSREANGRMVVSLGRAQISDEAVRSLTSESVSAVDYVDQWAMLRQADVFLTHQGLNSTHEAIYNQVPMISYPFFADQPSLAEKCRRFDLAVPLGGSPIASIASEDVDSAFRTVDESRDRLTVGVARARQWELDVIERRGSVADRIIELISDRPLTAT